MVSERGLRVGCLMAFLRLVLKLVLLANGQVFGVLEATMSLLAKRECQTEKTSLYRVHTASACAGERVSQRRRNDDEA